MTIYENTDAIRSLLDGVDIEEDKREKLRVAKTISHTDLIRLYKLNGGTGLAALLKSTKIYRPEPEAPAKSPEFLAQMEKLRLRQQELEYQQLVKNAAPLQPSTAVQAKEVKHQLTTILNILISVVSVGYAVWYWTGSSMRINDAYRILLSLFFALLTLVAEVVVFGGYLRKVEEARTVERRKKEVKKVVESVTL